MNLFRKKTSGGTDARRAPEAGDSEDLVDPAWGGASAEHHDMAMPHGADGEQEQDDGFDLQGFMLGDNVALGDEADLPPTETEPTVVRRTWVSKPVLHTPRQRTSSPRVIETRMSSQPLDKDSVENRLARLRQEFLASESEAEDVAEDLDDRVGDHDDHDDHSGHDGHLDHDDTDELDEWDHMEDDRDEAAFMASVEPDAEAAAAPEPIPEAAPEPVTERRRPAEVRARLEPAFDAEPEPRAEPEPDPEPAEVVHVPSPAVGRGGPRAGRVKTRLLGFEHAGEADADPFGKSDTPSRTHDARFPVGWLVVVTGAGRGASFSLFSGVSQIGRGQDQAVALDFGDTSISRSGHAVVAYDPELKKFFIGHNGKANIVRLNSKPVLSTEELSDGDLIKVGETTLRFVALCGENFDWNAAEGEGKDNGPEH